MPSTESSPAASRTAPPASAARSWSGLLLQSLALGLAVHALPGTRAALGVLTRADAPGLRVKIMFGAGLLALLLAAASSVAELRARTTGRFPDGAPALWRKAFVALIAAWLWTVFLQPDLVIQNPVPALTGAVGAAVFGAARLAAELPVRIFPASLRRALDLCCTSLCAAAVMTEASLQVTARLAPTPLLKIQRDDPTDNTLSVHRLVPGTRHLGQVTNSGGYVDTEFAARRPLTHRVVSIGDSFSIGVVPHAYHFTTVAEGLLDSTEICNMGASSIGPRQYLWLLREEALALAPDVVVVNLYAGNDLLDYEPPEPQRTWAVLYRRNVLLFLVQKRLRALARERARRGDSLDELEVSLGKGLPPGLTREQIAGLLPHLEDPALEKPNYSEAFFLELELERARLACGASRPAYALLLELLEQICAAAGDTPLVFMLIPDEFQVDDELWSRLLELTPGEDLERDRFQRLVGAALAERGVPVIDLLPVLRAVPPAADGRPHLFHLRDTHFNARGNHAAGQALAEGLRPLLR